MTLGRPRQYDLEPKRIEQFTQEGYSIKDLSRQFGIPWSSMRDQLIRAGFQFSRKAICSFAAAVLIRGSITALRG